MLHHDVILTLFGVYLFTVPVNLVNEKLRHTVHVQQLNCCVKKCQTLLHPTCGLKTAQISILYITRYGLSCSVVTTRDKSIVWMNWNGSSSVWCGFEQSGY